MAIHSFEFDAAQSAAFAALREKLYVDDCNWIATPRAAFLRQFAPEFPFYRRPGNRHRHFIATINGKTRAHVSAFVNGDLKDRDGAAVGNLGFFECVDDYALAADVLKQAIQWLQTENGVQRIWAPVNFDIWHGYRFMTRGFEEEHFYGEPYNQKYYPGFLIRFGFSAKKTWDSLERWGTATLESMIARFEPRYRSLGQQGYQFISVDVARDQDLRRLHSVLLDSYHGFLGMTPFGFDDFQRLLGEYLRAFEARFVNLVYDPRGDVAGFSVAYPDYSRAVRDMKGKDDLLTRLRFRFHHGQAGRVIFYMIGATPREIERRQGLGSAIYYYTVRQILNAGFKSVLFAIIADDSAGRRHFGEEMRFAQRTYTLYEL
jgi:hypothetical protein